MTNAEAIRELHLIAGEEIQVFIAGTGCALWGKVVPQERPGCLTLRLTVEPLPDTVEQVDRAGVRSVYGSAIARGKLVRIPFVIVDVVFREEGPR